MTARHSGFRARPSDWRACAGLPRRGRAVTRPYGFDKARGCPKACLKATARLLPPRPAASVIDALYGRIAAAARAPQLYLALGAPDTLEGRFGALALHVVLVLCRLRRLPPPADEVAQDLVDTCSASSTARCASSGSATSACRTHEAARRDLLRPRASLRRGPGGGRRAGARRGARRRSDRRARTVARARALCDRSRDGAGGGRPGGILGDGIRWPPPESCLGGEPT